MRQYLIPPTVEAGYLTPLSHKTVYVAPYFLASIPSFSLTRLISEAGFDTSAPYFLASMSSFSPTRLILAAGFDTCAKKGGDKE